jgi:hypothetical protein|tara:strand:+ start:4113 stop:4697 length:585 start_codon:yes stop_codon:yes gene_type:complete
MKAEQLKEGLADLAYKAESDHEVQMARAELYKIAKYAIKMHDMLKGVEEREGLEGWVQSKITKAADYMGSVYHHMDYETKFDEVQEAKEMSDKQKKFFGKKEKEDVQTKEKYNHDRGSKKKTKESYKSSLASILAEKVKSKTCCGTCGNEAAVEGQQYDEAKQRLDPKCWKGKKIGTPATKMKGGVRVNNCVPA